MQFTGLIPYLSGVVVLLLALVLYRLLAGTWDLGKLIKGADGRPSTSKLQWFIWTVVVIFAYASVYGARALSGHLEPISNIPQNLLVVMGLSITTMAAAKGITVAYVSSGQVVKTQVDPKRDPQAAGPGALVQNDAKVPDLSKIQMMVWTLIAVGVYVLLLVQEIGTTALPELPDIDPALMVLMGLGQGAYLGKKLTSTSVPRLTGLSPGSGNPGTKITIGGMSFGPSQGGSLLIVDGTPLAESVQLWQDTQIEFTLPARQSNGTDWAAGQRITIGVIVGGQSSVNTLPFTVTQEAT